MDLLVRKADTGVLVHVPLKRAVASKLAYASASVSLLPCNGKRGEVSDSGWKLQSAILFFTSLLPLNLHSLCRIVSYMCHVNASPIPEEKAMRFETLLTETSGNKTANTIWPHVAVLERARAGYGDLVQSNASPAGIAKRHPLCGDRRLMCTVCGNTPAAHNRKMCGTCGVDLNLFA